jgi:hypothetical protein
LNINLQVKVSIKTYWLINEDVLVTSTFY